MKCIMISMLLLNGSMLFGQVKLPLFFKDQCFDIVYSYDDNNETITKSIYCPSVLELNFSKNTFYLKNNATPIISPIQYEYFKMTEDQWLEVQTLNDTSIVRQFKVQENLTGNDSINFCRNYSSGFTIFQYYKLDTLFENYVINQSEKY